MTSPAAAAGLTGAIVAAGIAAAGAAAWLATRLDSATDMVLVAADASAPIDVSRLRADAYPVSSEHARGYSVQLCLPCHGARGDGRGEWAYRVTPRPANLTSPRTRGRSDAQLFELISEPQPGTPMIGWKKQLSPSQRRQVVAYVRHLSSGAGAETRH